MLGEGRFEGEKSILGKVGSGIGLNKFLGPLKFIGIMVGIFKILSWSYQIGYFTVSFNFYQE